MQQYKIYVIAFFAALLFTCAVDYGFGRLPVARTRCLPVDTFPTQVGVWHAGTDIPVQPEVQDALPSAKIVERIYTDGAGHRIDLTLVTALSNVDLHDPSGCLPGQGWQVQKTVPEKYGDQVVNEMLVRQEGHSLYAIYWFAGCYQPKLSNHVWVQDAARLRARLINWRENQSLVVRVLADTDINSEDVTNSFVRAIQPAVKQLTNKGYSQNPQ
jgi:EpsI family protein